MVFTLSGLGGIKNHGKSVSEFVSKSEVRNPNSETILKTQMFKRS